MHENTKKTRKHKYRKNTLNNGNIRRKGKTPENERKSKIRETNIQEKSKEKPIKNKNIIIITMIRISCCEFCKGCCYCVVWVGVGQRWNECSFSGRGRSISAFIIITIINTGIISCSCCGCCDCAHEQKDNLNR